MGKYVNPGNSAFQRIVKTGKYVVTYVSRVDDYIEFLELPGGK